MVEWIGKIWTASLLSTGTPVWKRTPMNNYSKFASEPNTAREELIYIYDDFSSIGLVLL